MKIPRNKFGMTADPTGGHCTMEYKGRTLIGTVVDFYRSEARGVTLLKVRHFNGDDWPLDPCFVFVDMLERELAPESP